MEPAGHGTSRAMDEDLDSWLFGGISVLYMLYNVSIPAVADGSARVYSGGFHLGMSQTWRGFMPTLFCLDFTAVMGSSLDSHCW